MGQNKSEAGEFPTRNVMLAVRKLAHEFSLAELMGQNKSEAGEMSHTECDASCSKACPRQLRFSLAELMSLAKSLTNMICLPLNMFLKNRVLKCRNSRSETCASPTNLEVGQMLALQEKSSEMQKPFSHSEHWLSAVLS